jgi:hypothetical protein
MVSAETLATTIAVRSAESFGDGFSDLEALAAMHGTGGAFRSLVPAGQYANSGAVLVELHRQGKGTDV